MENIFLEAQYLHHLPVDLIKLNPEGGADHPCAKLDLWGQTLPRETLITPLKFHLHDQTAGLRPKSEFFSNKRKSYLTCILSKDRK